MPGLAVLIFFSVLGITLLAIGVASRFMEAERKKRVSSLLKTTEGNVSIPRSAVLVESGPKRPSFLEQVATRLNLAVRLDAWLRQSGLEWTLGKVLALSGGAAVAGALVGLKIRILVDAASSSAGLACVFALLPWLFVASKRRKRFAEFEKEFPEALDFLARAVKAGHAFPTSLEMLARESPEPLQSEFRRVYHEQNLGESLAVVLRHLGDRMPLIDVRFFVAAVLMQRETGGNLGEILSKLSMVIRERFQLKGKVKAISAHGRLTALVLTFLPLVTVFVLMITGPQYLAGLVKESEGKYLVLSALAGQILGYLAMRKITNIKV